tara:strand:- start:1437 stop:2765 length:1329 start_codon:yes stop_codon:yes gene_type:complete
VNLKQIQSYLLQHLKKDVLRNIILVSSLTFITSLLGFFKEAVVASNYGLSLELDTFFVALLIPGLISTVFLGSYKSVFIPNYINEIHNNGNIKSFQTAGLTLTIFISIIFIIIAIIGSDLYLDFLFPNKSLEFYGMVKKQFYIILPSILFWGIASILGALLYVNNEFKFSSLSGIFTPIVILILIYNFKSEFDDTLLSWGTTIGAIISCLYLFIITKSKKILSLGNIELNNANIIITLKQLPAKISSGLLTALNDVVDQFFAAQLILGSITALNYGMKIPAFLASLLLVAFSNVLLPYFSKSVIADKVNSFRILFKNVNWVFIALILVSLIGIFCSDMVVSLLFERKEFTTADTKIVSTIQKIFLTYIPFKITGMIMVNFATSINENKIMAIISLVAVVLNVVLDFYFMEIYGVFGIAICTTIIVVFKSLSIYIYLKKISEK